MSNKPLEFFINKDIAAYPVALEKPYNADTDIHVIEMSAYKNTKTALSKTYECLKLCKEKNAALEQRIEKLRAAMEQIKHKLSSDADTWNDRVGVLLYISKSLSADDKLKETK